jgi:beta-lactamase superfamily II metal-dependent hydrolase
LKLQIFDVAHGACALLTCDNGTRIMIDCGHNATTGWKPGDYLARLGVTKLDMLMITNYDEDHVSGIRNLEERIYFDWLVRNNSVTGSTLLTLKSDTGVGTNIKYLVSRMSQFTVSPAERAMPVFPGVIWNVFNNPYPTFDDENNLSMAVSLTINGLRFLFPGDLEKAGWLQLLINNPAFFEAVKNTDVLVASHHGRQNGICESIFDTVGCKPKIIVISDDYHQYDTQRTLHYYGSKAEGMMLNGEQRKVLTTRCDGEISFDFAGKAYGVAEVSVYSSGLIKPSQGFTSLAQLAGLAGPIEPIKIKPFSLASMLAGFPPIR